MKRGYERTDVGIIPDDWKTEPLGKITTLMTNGFVGPAVRHYAKNDNGVLYIQGYNVKENSFNFHGVKYVTEEFHRAHMKSCLRSGDLLTIQTGEVGLTTIVSEALAGSNCHALIISRFDKKHTSPSYISYYLNSKPGHARLKLIETGTTMKHLNVGDMLQFNVPLPPTLSEQEAIAEGLSDADAFIEAVEQLIAKKRLLKQGAMQELLTGKRRLAGFSNKWEVKQFGELGTTFGGLTGKSKADFGHGAARYITFMNIIYNTVVDNQTFDLVNVKPTETQNNVVKGDLFFNGSSETPEEVGMCAVLLDDVDNVYVNSFCFGFRFRENVNVNGLYFAYYFRSQEGRELMKSLAQGAIRYNLSKTAFLKLIFPMPEYKEQTAIAEILSDMDAEITVLEEKLVKARQVKQGMMQELLTGRIRLV